MATFSVQDFVSEVSKTGLARQNRFEVLIPNIENEKLISLLCQGGTIPGASIVVKRQNLFGPTYIRPGNINYGESAQFSFLCDKNMDVKKMFDTWVHRVISPSAFTVNYKDEYCRDIVINQLDEGEQVTYSVKLIDAFPIALGSLSVNQAALDRFHILPVTFSYRYWETLDISNSEVYDPATPALIEKSTQPQIPRKFIKNDPAVISSNTPGSQVEGGNFTSQLPIAP